MTWWRTLLLFTVLIFAVTEAEEKACEPSITRSKTINGTICKGALIFEDTFEFIDLNKWSYEVTLAGGGNWEFQVYWEDAVNSFTENGILNIHPGYLADIYGEEFLWSGSIDLGDRCTQPEWYGCYREGTQEIYLNPATSARLHTVNTFSFTYGTVEMRAKMPAGDWLWTALWMYPQSSVYGAWPLSGEIDITESRGNRNLEQNGQNIGVKQAMSTMHWGLDFYTNQYPRTQWTKNVGSGPGFDEDFHNYRVEWTTEHIKFSLDDVEIGIIEPPAGGFYEIGQFNGPNPWAGGNKMAPFDQEFYLVLCLAVGGTNGFFPDDATNPGGKPWINNTPTGARDFWNGRGQWEPTWYNDGSTNLKIDYVRVWAAD